MGLRSFYASTNGKKIIMALTGIVLVGYVIGHAAGNLLVFRGPEAINAYAAFLKSNLALLWGVRTLLLVSFVLHVTAAVQLIRLARASRPVGYAKYDHQAAGIASRTMRWGGFALALFVVYHILHFTTGTAHPTFSHVDVYGNMIAAFRLWWVSAIYVAAMVALAFHLYHGVWSVFQTLGANHPAYNQTRRRFATIIAVLVAGGFIAIPLAILAGIIP